jgi:hypothetical protein
MKISGIIVIAFMLLGFMDQENEKAGKKVNINFISSDYTSESSDVIEFNKIVQDSVNYYHIEGKISFDSDGNTIQTITKNKIISKKDVDAIVVALKKKNYRHNFNNYNKVLYIQLRAKNEGDSDISDLGLSVSDKIEKALFNGNLGISYGTAMGDGVANMEFEVKDWEKALSLALEILNTENVLENCLVGRRLYLEEEDWNYEIVYPIAFDGMFYPY